jgi:N-acetyl-alpha-D-glucosaminyl L-malate synthase BshA
MRIGLTCHANFGGSGVIATELGLALAERGHDVHVVTAHAPPRLREATHVTLHVVESPTHPLFPHGEYALALASKLAEVCRTHALEVLHVHYAIPLATSALLACQLLGEDAPRLVTTVHGTDVLTLGQDPAFKPLVRQALLGSDLVTAPSRFLAQAAERDFALAGKSVEVVSNFVDTRRFAPKAAPPARPVLAHNSNFRSIKRMQDVVRIFERVRAEVACELVLLGDGPERPPLEAFIRERGLGPHVHLLGEQRDVAHVLQESSVFLLPSEVESFGLAAAEAMSCGVPVVASAVGGLPEVIEHGKTGFLHPVGEVEAMAASAVQLLRDGGLHRSMSEAARAACLARFQPGPLVNAWEAHYRQVLRSQA